MNDILQYIPYYIIYVVIVLVVIFFVKKFNIPIFICGIVIGFCVGKYLL